MKILLSAVAIITLIGVSLSLCSSPAEPHGGERIAIYNLSTTIRIMGRQLDRIEARLAICDNHIAKQ